MIEANRKIAQEDYDRVIEELNPVYKALIELNKTLKTQSREVETSVSRSEQDYLKPISEIYNRLRESRSMDIENLQAMVRAKKRTVAHFTIVMMGRTKAGKSTLFSTLLGTKYERIGTGQQRTTRQNYTYDLGNGIRLIDTPGIAAVGGEKDEAEALKAVNEADLICYLVTNDSIQESEFDFFDKLKRQTKPLIILLNVQDNLEDEDLLEFFLDDPDEELTGKDIEDHKKRIFNYARKKYNNDSIVVIPVMLLAARLSRQKQDPELCKQLYEASRIQDFLKRIDDAIKNYGSLLTSQTIIGETSVLLTPPLLAIQNERKICLKLVDTIKQKKQETQIKLTQIRKDCLNQLKLDIDSVFNKLVYEIPQFARRNWKRSPQEQQQAWKDIVEDTVRVEERLKKRIENCQIWYKNKVQEVLEEISQDISFMGTFGYQADDFPGFDPGFDVRQVFNFAAVALGLAGLGAFFIPLLAPIGIFAGVSFAVVSLSKNLLQSKNEREQKACNKIQKHLQEQVKQQQKTCTETIIEKFEESCNQCETRISKRFNGIAKEFEIIAKSLVKSELRLCASRKRLTGFLSLRILDWCNSHTKPLAPTRLGQEVGIVRRKPNCFFTIYIKNTIPLPLAQKTSQCSQMIGEKINFTYHS